MLIVNYFWMVGLCCFLPFLVISIFYREQVFLVARKKKQVY